MYIYIQYIYIISKTLNGSSNNNNNINLKYINNILIISNHFLSKVLNSFLFLF